MILWFVLLRQPHNLLNVYFSLIIILWSFLHSVSYAIFEEIDVTENKWQKDYTNSCFKMGLRIWDNIVLLIVV